MVLALRDFRNWILKVTAAQNLMDIAADANPYGAIVLAITAVITIMVELYKHDKKFRKFVNGILRSAKKLASGTIKQFSNLWGDAKKIFGNGFKVIEKATNGFIDLITGHWGNLKKDLISYNKAMFKLIKSVFKGAFDYLDDLTDGKLGKIIDLFSDAWHSIGKGWKDFWNGIDSWFGNLWKGIVSHVQTGINDVIKVLNGGLSGIDSVIHAFGGSDHAIGKIGYVHFAEGTGVFGKERRAITKPTMAILNDGHDSPATHNQEVIAHPNGALETVKGVNVKRFLEPHAEVFKASEAAALGLTHYAKGTGIFSKVVHGAEHMGKDVVQGITNGLSGIGSFASKAWHGATHLFSTIKKLIASPAKYLNQLLGKKPSEKGLVLNDFAGGFFNSMKKQAGTWWSTLWNMASSKIHDGGVGDASGLLAAMEKYGHGKRYVWGASGPDTFDCSGLVMYALKHAFGISYPHFSGAQIAKGQSISRSHAKPGDLIGNNEHVGVYAGHGEYYSALNPHRHPNIGMSPVSTFPGTPHFARVAGISNVSKSKDKNKTKSGGSGLQALIKRETGGMMSWIEKHLAPLADDGGGSYGNPGGAGVERWKPYVVKALKANHFSGSESQVAAWLRVIARESNGNPKAVNHWDSNAKAGHPSEGLVQTIGPTFNAYKFKGHGQILNGYDDLLAGIHYMASRYGRGPSAFARVSGPEGYAKGGHISKNQLSVVGEKGWELFKPDTAGTVIPHDTAKRAVKGMGGKSGHKIEINAPMKVVVQGNADKKSLAEINHMLQKHDENLVDKLSEALGFNNDGGLIV